LLTPASIRAQWSIPADAPIALYTGTFEAYQGVNLLIDASARLAQSHPSLRVVVVGGEPTQIEAARSRAAAAGALPIMIFTGQQPAREIPAFVALCDVLVSPRIRGTNTPLKIYSYLRSGKPIVATDLRTHTQVLSPDVARLVAADAEALAAAVADLLDRPHERERLASAAAALAARKYSRQAYVQRTADAYARLIGAGRAGRAGRAGDGLMNSEIADESGLTTGTENSTHPTSPTSPTRPTMASQ
jgi:glycosyltransferase involved in cell wall biosynthesis